MKILRQTKNGNLSLCSSPNDKIGKGRCNHVIGDINIKIVYDPQEKNYSVNVSDSGINMTEKESKEKIASLINNIHPLPEQTQRKILDFLEKN
jgi:hypothetical protein